MKRALGQFMTPTPVAQLVARELGPCRAAIDLAVGDGSLLKAIAEQSERKVRLIGCDIDARMVAAARAALGDAVVRHVDGLRAKFAPKDLCGQIGIAVNPPFLGESPDRHGWVMRAFPDLIGKRGTDRAEVQFLARALVLGRDTAARVAVVMPIGFADGDTYRRVRASLMQHYRVVKCVEVIGAPFLDTEARTVVLVIDGGANSGGPIEIREFDCRTGKSRYVARRVLVPGERLDARYHKVRSLSQTASSVKLKDLDVSITRGLFSRKEAEQQNVSAVHTSHLARAVSGQLAPRVRVSDADLARHVVAEKGDILFPRTGSRVRWHPVVVRSGRTPITDHVFRIRAPEAVQDVIYRSFRHPSFDLWLHGISKGVCATVVTKRELLEMPLFAWANSGSN